MLGVIVRLRSHIGGVGNLPHHPGLLVNVVSLELLGHQRIFIRLGRQLREVVETQVLLGGGLMVDYWLGRGVVV